MKSKQCYFKNISYGICMSIKHFSELNGCVEIIDLLRNRLKILHNYTRKLRYYRANQIKTKSYGKRERDSYKMRGNINGNI